MQNSPSDHRTAWVDIPWHTDLGYNHLRILRPIARRLQNSDPRVVKRYNNYLEAFVIKHQLNGKEEHIKSLIDYPPFPNLINEYEKLDRLHHQGMLAAERKSRKLRMGNAPYSPELSKAEKTEILWSNII